MIYLAAPYSHPDAAVRDERAAAVNCVFARLSGEGRIVFSTLSMTHEAAKVYNMPKDADFWWEMNMEFFRRCDEMYVVCLEGWAKSSGVRMEIEWAKFMRYPITYVDEFGDIISPEELPA